MPKEPLNVAVIKDPLMDLKEKHYNQDPEDALTRVRRILGGVIQAINLAVEIRDPYVAGHQRRVANLSRSIAQRMGLSEDQIEGIRIAGSIHDFGKILIPSGILNKPSQLSAIEFKLVKNHVETGYNIFKEINFPWPVAPFILEHHEKIDGSGYPAGLKGNQIHIESRILTVADVVEAMTSNRSYRPPYKIESALEEISNHKGVLYDPEVLEACLELFKTPEFNF
jgi:HD-GYP domain-containing protein (c-di-GMP phosphodiesterase class II)